MIRIDPLYVKKEIEKGNLILAKDKNNDFILLCDAENGETFSIGRISELKDIREVRE